MSEITLGQIESILLWLTGFGGGIAIIVKAVKKAIASGFKPISDKIDKVDKNATMNYLVAQMDSIDKGLKLEGVARKRFFDEYEHYTEDLDGNTYVKEEYERLKKEGKL